MAMTKAGDDHLLTGTTSRRRTTADRTADHTGLNLQGTTSSDLRISSWRDSSDRPTSSSREPSSRRELTSSSRGRSFLEDPTSSSREPSFPKEHGSSSKDSSTHRDLDSSSRGLSFPREATSSSSGRSRSPARSISSWGPAGAAGAGGRRRRQSGAGNDIPEFDRNKVSLDIPGSLFGPSVSLLIRTTKIIGDVIQNSAVRYQTFLRLFRPLFRGPFEIKGLDPPTTTTTTPRTTTTTSRAEDNEVRRRRHL